MNSVAYVDDTELEDEGVADALLDEANLASVPRYINIYSLPQQ